MVCNDELLFIIVLAFQNKLLFFSLNPNFLGVAMTRTKNSYIFVTYVPCWGFFFTVKVRVYLVKSGIAYKVSTVR